MSAEQSSSTLDEVASPVAVASPLATTSSTAATTPVADASVLAVTPAPFDPDPLATQAAAKRSAVNQKIRNENRERKKRWREANEDRNKDNDLRCRVNKRALKLFGKADSEHKTRWIEEEFSKRQVKRKEKERKKNPRGGSEEEDTPQPAKPSLSLSEQLALHAQATAQAAASLGLSNLNSQEELQRQQLHTTTAALNQGSAQLDPNTLKTALALNDLVKKTNGTHLDLAQLTGVLADPNLARQLLELEASSNAAAAAAVAAVAAGGSSQQASNVMLMNHNTATTHMDSDVAKASQMLDTEYPMDAVLTLMQLNGSWKA